MKPKVFNCDELPPLLRGGKKVKDSKQAGGID